MDKMKAAMRDKDQARLEALRAIKAELLNAKTAAGAKELTEDDEMKLLQRLVKQRLDSMQIFQGQNRADLAEKEESQARIISEFLPAQLSEEEIEKIVDEIIAETGADSMKDMGRIMGLASDKMAGRANNKTVSVIVRNRLNR